MKKGRKRKLTDEEAADVRRMYFDRNAGWSLAGLARLFRVSSGTINHAVERTGAYKKSALDCKKDVDNPDDSI